MTWREQLDNASFLGIEFDVMRTRDVLAYRMAEYSFPGQNGSRFESMGRQARPTTLTVIFHGEGHEARLTALMTAVDEQKNGRFVHPLLGSWTAICISATIGLDASARDSAEVELELAQDGLEIPVEQLVSVLTLQNEIELRAVDTEEEATALDVDAIDAFIANARAFADDAEDFIDDIDRQVNVVRKKADDALNAIDELSQIEKFPIVRSIIKLNHSCAKLADRVRKLNPVVQAEKIAANQPLTVLAHRLYGDWERALYIRDLNKTRNPFLVRAGSTVKTYKT